jgi:DNA polymerase-3 subunit delta
MSSKITNKVPSKNANKTPKIKHTILIEGSVDLMRQQALNFIISSLNNLNVTRINPSEYVKGTLFKKMQLSLFGEPSLVIVENAENANAVLVNDILSMLNSDSYLVVMHSGANKARKIINAIKSRDSTIFNAVEPKYERDKVRYLQTIFANKKRVDATTLQIILQTYADFNEAIAVTSQIVNDAQNDIITQDIVKAYIKDTVEVSEFNLIDLVIAKDVQQLIPMLKTALISNVEPLLLVSLLFSKFKSMMKVASNNTGTMPNWLVQKVRGEMRFWDEYKIKTATSILAECDEKLKSTARNREYALESTFIKIAML